MMTALLILISLPSSGQAQIDQRRYATPEYSGPSARMDRGLEGYRTGRELQRNNAAQELRARRLRTDDRAFDYETQRRFENIQREMDMRRDEVQRAREHRIMEKNRIRTNE